MRILVIHDGQNILAWLVGEHVSNAVLHIENGYPELKIAWENGVIKAENIDVPADDAFRPELYGIKNGKAVKL